MIKVLTTLLLASLSYVAIGQEKPNIIMILSDDVGIGDIKSYAPESKVTTANIDKLAAQGMRFTQAYAPGSVCSPSRYSLLTGLYPYRGPLRYKTAKPTSPSTIEAGMLTWPKFLQQQGYRTAHIGKWHLGFGDSKTGIKNWAAEIKPGALELGFDYHLALPANHSDNFKTYVENHQLLWLKPSITKLSGKPTKAQLTQVRYDDEVDSTLTDKALEFIEANHKQPFFLYLALVATHTHITPHKKFRGSSNIGQLGDYINEMDYHVGEVMTKLDQLGLTDNTIVIFSSDNGGQDNDTPRAGSNLDLRDSSHNVAVKAKTAKTDAREKFGHKTNGDLRGYKASNFEGGFRVPLIVRWPQKIASGMLSDQVVALTDMYATTAGLLNRKLPNSVAGDSFDFSPVLQGKKIDGSIRDSTILQTGNGLLAFRQGDWKLRYKNTPKTPQEKADFLNSPVELYNLARDPYETTDVSRRNQKRIEQMKEDLSKLLQQGYSRENPVI